MSTVNQNLSTNANTTLDALFTPSGSLGVWTRLSASWPTLLCYILGIMANSFVIAISFFSKQISGDYKWFIANQAIANFATAASNFFGTVIVIALEPARYRYLLLSKSLLFSIYFEVMVVEVSGKIGGYATLTTLLATVANRFVNIATPSYYSRLMSRRLIIFYCFLTYLSVLPIDRRFLSLFLSQQLVWVIEVAALVCPWMISLTFCALTYRVLYQHLRTVSNSLHEKNLKDKRSVMRALSIQIVMSCFDFIPRNVLSTLANLLSLDTSTVLENVIFSLWSQIALWTAMYSPVTSCVVILVTMGPYRRAALAVIKPAIDIINKIKPNYGKLSVTVVQTLDRANGQN